MPFACWRPAAFLGTRALLNDLTGDGAGVLAFSSENSLPTLRVNNISGILAAIEAVLAEEDLLFFAGEKLLFLEEDFFFFSGIRRFGWHLVIHA